MVLPALGPLTPGDRRFFEGALSATVNDLSPTPLSAYSFAYHYLWQDHFRFLWTYTAGHLFLFAGYEGHLYMPLPPLGPFDAKAIRLGWELLERENRLASVSRIENIPETWVEGYERLGFRLLSKDPDYLYLRSDLENLCGNRYKSQRWACNRFERGLRPELVPYTTDQEEACRRLLLEWEGDRLRRHPGADYRAMLQDSRAVHLRALAEAGRIGLTGRVLRTEGDVVGYSFGYPLSAQTFCILLEVTRLPQIGAAAYLFRAFCRELYGYTWINTLDDSGLANLQRTKEAYSPVRKIPSYIAVSP